MQPHFILLSYPIKPPHTYLFWGAGHHDSSQVLFAWQTPPMHMIQLPHNLPSTWHYMGKDTNTFLEGEYIIFYSNFLQ